LVRLRVLEDFGLGALDAVHALPRPKIMEQEDTVAVDFARMAGKGVTYTERAAQLRYMTNDNGELLLDDNGQKIPRLTYELRKYATDPNGPVKAKETVVLFWTPAQLVKEILEAEKNSGTVISPGDKKKLEKGSESAQKEANVGLVNIRRAGIGAGIGAGDKQVSFRIPATNRKVNVKDDRAEAAANDDDPTPDLPIDEAPSNEEAQADTNGYRAPGPKVRRTPNKAKPASAPEPQAAAVPASLTPGQLMEAFGPVMQQIAEEAAKSAVAAYAKEQESQKNAILAAVKENQDVIIGGLTVLHDVLAPTILDDPDRLLIKKGADILAYFEDDGGNEG
jgi:hypothetical protein